MPSVLFGVTLFGDSLADGIADDGVRALSTALATAVGTNTSLVAIQSVEYVLQLVVAVTGVTAAAASSGTAAVGASVMAATGSSTANVSLSMVGVNTGGARRRLLGSVEYTARAYSASLANLLVMNSTLNAVVSNGSLAATLVTAGVNTTGVQLPVQPLAGVQLHVAVKCPDGGIAGDGTLLPNVTTMVQRTSAGTLDSSASLLSDFSSAGLGVISGVSVSLTPVIGALLSRLLPFNADATRD